MKDKKKQSFFLLLIKGAIIGLGGILPGASGGILAVATGVYERIFEAISNLFKDIKSSLSFLLPLLLGSLIGLIPMSFLLEWLLGSFEVPVTYVLIGLVLGGIPSFLKEANSQNGFKPKYLIGTFIGLSAAVALFFLEKTFSSGNTLEFNFFTAMLSGGLIATGIVIPGISSSFILMFLGLYEPLLNSLNSFNIPMLFAALLGGVIVAVLLFLFVRKMLKKYRSATYYTSFGLLLGTVFLIFPAPQWSIMQVFYTFLLILGFFCSFFMDKFDTTSI